MQGRAAAAMRASTGVSAWLSIGMLAAALVVAPGAAAQDGSDEPPPFEVVRAPDGTTPQGAVSFVDLTPDGRIVVFGFKGEALTAVPDPDQTTDVYLWDRSSDQIALVSRSVDANRTANGRSDNPRITRDGRFVFYRTEGDVTSQATRKPDGTSYGPQLVRYEVATGNTIMVSRSADDAHGCEGGILGNGWDVSADGSKVVLNAACPSRIDETQWAGATHGNASIGTWWWTPSGGMQLLSTGIARNDDCTGENAGGADVPALPNGFGSHPEMTDDGRFVAFDGWVDKCLERLPSKWVVEKKSESGSSSYAVEHSDLLYDVERDAVEPVGALEPNDPSRYWLPGDARGTNGSQSAVWILRRDGQFFKRRGNTITPLTLAGHGDHFLVYVVMLSRDGSSIVYRRAHGATSENVNVWRTDLTTGESVNIVDGHSQHTRLLDIDATGNTVLLSGDPASFGFPSTGRRFDAGKTLLFRWERGETGFTRVAGRPPTTDNPMVDDSPYPFGWLSDVGSSQVWLDPHPLLVDNDDNQFDDLFAIGDIPDPPDPAPIIGAIEVNQAVQTDVLAPLPDEGFLVGYPVKRVPLVTGRDTLVRLYPFAPEDAGIGYTANARLKVDLVVTTKKRMPGSPLKTQYLLDPNVDGEKPVFVDAADAQADERDRQILHMRLNPDRTIEFVLDDENLAFAENEFHRVDSLLLTPWHATEDRAISGTVDVPLRQADTLRVHLVEFYDPKADDKATRADRARFMKNVKPYVLAAAPFADVKVVSSRRMPGGINSVSGLSLELDAKFRTEKTLSEKAPEDWTVALGLTPNVSGDNGATMPGIVKQPGDGWSPWLGYGNKWVSVAKPFGDIVAHEIGHGMGSLHAARPDKKGVGGHKERGPEWWPYPDGWNSHGTEDARGHGFGAIMTPSGSGRFAVDIVRPCDTSNGDDLLHKCTTDSARVHDLMSYGSGGSSDFGPFDPGSFTSMWSKRWPSGITWRRMVTATLDGRPDPLPFTEKEAKKWGVEPQALNGGRSLQNSASTDSLLVTVVEEADGSVALLSALPIPVPPATPTDDVDTRYVVEARDADGAIVASGPVLGPLHDVEPRYYTAEIAAVDDVAELAAVDSTGTVVAAWPASDDPPWVEILTPSTTALQAGPTSLDVELSDPDGDPLSAVVSVSGDGGETWNVVDVVDPVPDGPLAFDLTGIPATTGSLVVRVDVSDGLRIASAERTFTFDAFACPDGRVPEDGFGDVPASSVHEPAVDCASWWGLARGRSASEYDPLGTVRRDQMASFLARLLEAAWVELPPYPADHFADDDGNTHELRINQLAELGVIKGTTETTYAPTAPVRRDQMATFLVRVYELIAETTLPSPTDHFTDDEESFHEDNINAAADAGFAAGRSPNRFDPFSGVRRDQMATFLVRVLERLVDEAVTTPPDA